MWRCTVLLVGLLVPASSHAADPSALWKIVHGQCVPHEEAARDPSPCASVDLAEGVDRGFALLKDRVGVSQFLLIPTARIGGIEDPVLLAPDAVNYWDRAWRDRYFVEERLHAPLPREAVSLAVNSVDGRSQNQLHIHIDCVRVDVRDALRQNLDKITDVWTPFPLPLAGQHYRTMRIPQETLDVINPFRVLADADPVVAEEMGKHTLVVVGATFPGNVTGFILLTDRVDLLRGDFASGEDLQDHSCAVAKQ